MANRNHSISVDLRLLTAGFNSQLTSMKSQIEGTFSSLGKSAESTFNPTSALQTGAWITGFAVIQRAGEAAFSGINSRIKSAMEYQDSLVSSAGNYSNLLKINYQDAMSLATRLNMADSKNNMGLPFGDLRKSLKSQVGDDFLGAFYDKNNVEKSILRTTSLLGKLAIVAGGTDGVTDFQRSGFISTFLSARNEGDLTRQKVYRNNPAFQRAYTEQIKATGKSLADLGRTGRIQLLEAITGSIVTDEVKGRYQGTLSAKLSSLNSQFFDENIGLLSFTRQLQPGKMSSSIISALTGLFDAAANVKGEGLSKFADNLLGTGVSGINSLTSAIKGGFGSGLIGAGGSIGAGIFDGIKLGISGIGIAASTVLVPLDSMLRIFGGLQPVIQTVTAAITGLIVVAGTQIAIGWIGGLATSMVALAGVGYSTIVAGFTGINYILGGFNLLLGVLNIELLPVITVIGALGLAVYTLWKYWEPVKAVFRGVFDGLIAGINSASPIVQAFKSVMSGLGSVVSGIAGNFHSLTSSIGGATSGLQNFLGTQSQAQKTSGFQAGLSGTSKGIEITTKGILQTLPVVGSFFKADGHPGMSTGLFNAINQESNRMPSGAGILIANSSEMILNKSQQSNLGGIMSSRGTPITMTNHFHITGKTDEIESVLRDKFENILQDVWNKAQNGYV